MTGLFMFVLSYSLDNLLGEGGDTPPPPGAPPPNVTLLTAIFFALNFLAATQDIAVDGWALTMLSRWVCSALDTEMQYAILGYSMFSELFYC